MNGLTRFGLSHGRRNWRKHLAAIMAATAASSSVALATDGTWNVAGSGSWNTPGNWVGSTTANGTDATADFSTKDITAAAAVSLDGNWSIGTLKTGDAGSSPNQDWTFNAGTPSTSKLTLTVSSGAPVINVVNRTATISTVIDGTQGFIKQGVGTLVLANAANTFTGDISVNAGTLRFNSAGAIGGTGRNIYAATDAVVAAGYAMDNGFLNRIEESDKVFTIALSAASGKALDFSSSTGANLTNATLGAVSAQLFTGTLTPNSNTYRLGGGNSSLTLNTANILTGNSGLVVGAAGTSWSVVLAQANNYTGGTTLQNGLLQFANNGLGTSGSIVVNAGTLRWAAGNAQDISGRLAAGSTGTLDSNGNSVTLTSGVTLGSVTKTGAGSILFLGNNSSFGALALNSTGDLWISGSGDTITSVSHTGTGTLTLGGSVTIGTMTVDASSTTAAKVVADTGASVTIGNGAGALTIVNFATNSASTHTGLVDMTAASSLTVNVSAITVSSTANGNTTTTPSSGTLRLSNTSNAITASAGILLGTDSQATRSTGTIEGGAGATTMATPTLTVGGQKGIGVFTLASTGSLTLTGATGPGSRAVLGVGYRPNDSNSLIGTGTMALDGTFNASLSSLLIGYKAGGGGTAGGAQGAMTISSSTLNHLDISGATSGTASHANGVLVVGRLDSGSTFAATASATGVGSLSIGYLDATSSVTNSSTVDPALLIGAYNDGAAATGAIGPVSGTMTFSGGFLSVLSGGSAPAIKLANINSGTNGVNDIVSGTLNLLGGTLTVNNDIAAGKASGSASATSTLNIDGGLLSMAGKNIGSSAAPINNLILASGGLQNVAEINGGVGTLNKTTGGTLTLTGTDTFTNAVAVQAGTLLVNGSTSGGGNYTVGASATLGGTGTIGLVGGNSVTLTGTDVDHQAALSPGASIGHLGVTGDVVFGSFSRLNVETDTTAGSPVDTLAISGQLNLSGSADALYLSGTLAGGQAYTVVTAGLVNGTFDAVYWNGNLVASPQTGGIGNAGDYYLEYGPGSIALVPEPTSVVLMLIGLLPLARRRRRDAKDVSRSMM